MRRSVFVLLAAIAAGVASGMTVDWKGIDTAGKTQGTWATNGQFPNDDKVNKGALRATFTLSGKEGETPSGYLMVFGGTGNNSENQGLSANLGVRLHFGQDGALTADVKFGTIDETPYAMTSTGKGALNLNGRNEVAMVADRTNNTVSVFINGVEAFQWKRSGDQANINGFYFNSVAFGQDLSGGNALSGVKVGDLELGNQVGLSADDLRDYYAALPEPTALALLALGAAGVALRRRAA